MDGDPSRLHTAWTLNIHAWWNTNCRKGCYRAVEPLLYFFVQEPAVSAKQCEWDLKSTITWRVSSWRSMGRGVSFKKLKIENQVHASAYDTKYTYHQTCVKCWFNMLCDWHTWLNDDGIHYWKECTCPLFHAVVKCHLLYITLQLTDPWDVAVAFWVKVAQIPVMFAKHQSMVCRDLNHQFLQRNIQYRIYYKYHSGQCMF